MTVPSAMSRARWEHFPHDADVGVRGFGATPAEAFAQAALALTAVATRARIEPLSPVEVRCEAPDLELLFVDWLNAIIYEMAVRRMLFARFDVRIEGTELQATLWGEPVDVARHAPARCVRWSKQWTTSQEATWDPFRATTSEDLLAIASNVGAAALLEGPGTLSTTWHSAHASRDALLCTAHLRGLRATAHIIAAMMKRTNQSQDVSKL